MPEADSCDFGHIARGRLYEKRLLHPLAQYPLLFIHVLGEMLSEDEVDLRPHILIPIDSPFRCDRPFPNSCERILRALGEDDGGLLPDIVPDELCRDRIDSGDDLEAVSHGGDDFIVAHMFLGYGIIIDNLQN